MHTRQNRCETGVRTGFPKITANSEADRRKPAAGPESQNFPRIPRGEANFPPPPPAPGVLPEQGPGWVPDRRRGRATVELEVPAPRQSSSGSMP